MKRYAMLTSLVLVFVFSCKKDNTNTSEYYIQCKTDGTLLNAAYICPQYNCEQDAANYMNYVVNIYRNVSESDRRGFFITINDVNIESWQLPDTLYTTAPAGHPSLNFTYYSGIWSSANSFISDSTLGTNSFMFIVTSKTKYILEGTFSGELRNGTNPDLKMIITEGKFKIKVILPEDTGECKGTNCL